MDKSLILPRVIGQSRIRIAQKAGNYYEFTQEQLLAYTENIVKECAAIADSNHETYKKMADALSNVMVTNTGDLIRNHYGVE